MGRPKTMDQPTGLHIRVPQSLYDELLALSEAKSVGLSTLTRWALKEYVQQTKEKHDESHSA